MTDLTETSHNKIALVCMPFMATDRPSLGLSLLKSGLARIGIPCSIHYLNLTFARMAGLDPLNTLDFFPEADLVKEWIFTRSLWGKDDDRDHLYIKNVLEGGAEEHNIHKTRTTFSDCRDAILSLKSTVERFLEYCMDNIPWQEYKLVGFSSLFQQQIPSLSLAKRLKDKFPNLYIVFGGAACREPSGRVLLEAFPFIDAVCPGEGDMVFPAFVNAFLTHDLPRNFPGMIQQSDAPFNAVQNAPRTDLNRLAYPDYHDFFEQVTMDEHLLNQDLLLMLESSRGCWWGEKSPCTFCGLNGSDRCFRKKDAPIVLEEIKWMIDHYGCHTKAFYASDCIMPREYKKELLPQLAACDLDITIFYEIKANQKKKDIQRLFEAGVTGIQPGIESLSTAVLKIMGKGVTALQNIQLLKNCLLFGVAPEWNFLVGFPGETRTDYQGLDDLIPALTHLPPPHLPGIRRIRFDRFSAYLVEPEKFNLKNIRPYSAYSFIFPGLSRECICDLAYYFVCDFKGQDAVPSYTATLKKRCEAWMENHHRSALFTVEENDRLVLYDFRPGFSHTSTVLKNESRLVFDACDQITTRSRLEKILSEHRSAFEKQPSLDVILDPLMEQQWIIRENQKYLSLAIPLGFNYFPPEGVWHRFNTMKI